ncbi:DUF4365 domain-containing protein [Deinococcus sp. UR1]|uniref:DUF4365 domain-containing protein n=1 Tax=Deinococcus sp. UR1 TaxID=1704277 RepID=UPI000A3DFA4B|nr:DUF4365 domain-containing protein [Deinococcus sp. UR1]PIG99708.1 hypothetical protein AMD26_002055 [Deinococcus sp. UR1]
MPRRSLSQKRGDFALANVIKLCSEHGWICEVVGQDYGEDISIQATVNGSVDSFRIWIQVKGYSESSYRKKRSGELSVHFDRNHLLKWLRSLETVIVVLYDQDTGCMLWCYPQGQFYESFLNEPFGNSGKNLVFNRSDEFDLSSIAKIEWAARLDYYSKSIAIYEYYERNFSYVGEERSKPTYSMLLAFTFGVELDIFKIGNNTISVNSEFVEGILRVKDKVIKGELDFKKIKTSMLLGVVGHIGKKTSNPVDETVILKIVSGITLLIFGIYDLDKIRRPLTRKLRPRKYSIRRSHKRHKSEIK